MNFTIHKIILWSEHIENEKREITFNTESINVISGESGRGKSAIISIIDYCLASSGCYIPVGIIRESVSWFGIVVEINQHKLLLARKSPLNGKMSNDMFNDQITNDEVPDYIETNCNYRDVINLLNEYGNISNLSLENNPEKNPAKERVSIRDLISLNFQPQHIVANPYALYYKADTYKNREKLKKAFDYGLGIIDNKVLEAMRELDSLSNRINELREQKKNDEKALSSWNSRINNYYTKAIELGLLPTAPDLNIETISNTEKVKNLKTLNRFLKTNELPELLEGRFENASKISKNLRSKELSLSRKVDSLRRKSIRLDKLKDANNQLHSSLLEQKERTRSVRWFSNKLNLREQVCPFCESTTNSNQYLDSLKIEADKLSELSSRSASGTKIYQKELNKLKDDLGNAENDLNTVRNQINEFYNENDNQKEYSVTLTTSYEIIGRINELVSVFENIRDNTWVEKEIAKLEKRIITLEKITNKSQIKKNRDKALTEISNLIQYYSSGFFNAERSNEEIALDIENLTVSFKNIHGDKNFLWEIGSGHNFLAYHVSAMLSIHQYLYSLEESKVPQLLIFDQPSQVYFPEDISNKENQNDQDDIKRVRQLFKALAEFFSKTNKKVQIIVLEHVGETGWTGVKNIDLRHRWRQGETDNALIPEDWIIIND